MASITVRFSTVWKTLLAALVAGLFAGCMTPPVDDPARLGPFFTPTNFTRDAMLPPTLRRVILLPVSGTATLEAETAATLDSVFTAELQKQNRFEVVTLSRAECYRRFGYDSFDSTVALPRNFLASLQRDYAADAVIFIDITSYRPYHPLVIGVRSKCATMDGSRLYWSFDTVFTASDMRVVNSARHHFLESDRGGVPADMSSSVLQSPSRFAAYAASATFRTLPPVFSVKPVMTVPAPSKVSP